MTPEEAQAAHEACLKDLDEVLEETEDCLDRVKTKSFTRTRKQQAFLATVVNEQPKRPINPFPPAT